MKVRFGWLALASIAVVSASTARAEINGLHVNERVFNDFSTSALAVATTTNSATIAESLYTDDGMGGNFANRHDVLLSSDNGASANVFGLNESWTFSTIVTLDAGTDVPQVKEAGIRLNSPGEGVSCGICTGDALFLVKTNGEIAAFGGGAPFFLFSAGMGVTNDYIPGQPMLLGMKMTAAGDGIGPADNTIEYFIDRLPFAPGGEETSGPLSWENNEGGPVNYNIGVYAQSPPDLANPTEFLAASFNDISFVPEPTTAMMSVLGLLAVGMIRRRAH